MKGAWNITQDRTISGSYDWLRLGQGETDRQCLLRSPAVVAYRDRSLRVVAQSRKIGHIDGKSHRRKSCD